MKTINATVFIKPNEVNSFLTMADELTTATRNEPGNSHFELYQSNNCPSTFVFVEVYQDQAAIIAHRDSDHFQKFLKASQAIQNAPMDVMIFDGLGADN